jgi:hypothetical protein
MSANLFYNVVRLVLTTHLNLECFLYHCLALLLLGLLLLLLMLYLLGLN